MTRGKTATSTDRANGATSAAARGWVSFVGSGRALAQSPGIPASPGQSGMPSVAPGAAVWHRVNLGFVVETERQVEEHLTTHMERLPAGDAKSRAIVEKMRDDEARHGAAARAAGAEELPLPLKGVMRVAADLMRLIAYRV